MREIAEKYEALRFERLEQTEEMQGGFHWRKYQAARKTAEEELQIGALRYDADADSLNCGKLGKLLRYFS